MRCAPVLKVAVRPPLLLVAPARTGIGPILRFIAAATPVEQGVAVVLDAPVLLSFVLAFDNTVGNNCAACHDYNDDDANDGMGVYICRSVKAAILNAGEALALARPVAEIALWLASHADIGGCTETQRATALVALAV